MLNQPNFHVVNKDRIVDAGQELIDLLSVHNNCISPLGVEVNSILTSISVVQFDRCTEIVEIILLRIVKLLLLEPSNRSYLQKYGVEVMVKILHQRLSIRKSATIITEICGMILNACYEIQNVDHICATNNGVFMILNCIHHVNEDIVGSSLGVLQAICYAPMGRRTLRMNFEILNKLVSFLSSEKMQIRSRALGVIHNISVDSVAIQPLVNARCLDCLVKLLEEDDEEICAVALGTLQNLTRDTTVKNLACEADLLSIVIRYLVSPSVPCQVAALGTFMNLSDQSQGTKALHSLLAETIALGAINSCIFESKQQK